MGLSGSANAEVFTAAADPSGADMCFDSRGDKAPLAACDTFVSQVDPSGVAMCFTRRGDKAPLSQCQTPKTAVVTVAPKAKSGAFMAVLSFFR